MCNYIFNDFYVYLYIYTDRKERDIYIPEDLRTLKNLGSQDCSGTIQVMSAKPGFGLLVFWCFGSVEVPAPWFSITLGPQVSLPSSG
jgi:hypothetical protein